MTRPLTTAVKQDLLGGQQNIVLHLLEIQHTSLPDTLRYTSDGVNTIYNSNVYSPKPFVWVMPEVGEQGAPRAAIRMSNVDPTLIRTLRNLVGGGKVWTWTGYFIASDLSAPFLEVPNMRIATIDVQGEESMTLNLAGRFLGAEPSPSTIMNGKQYPGLFP